MRLIVLMVVAMLMSACTAMMVGGNGSSSNSNTTTQNESHRAADSALRAEVRNKLAAHPEIGVFDVNVSVKDGYVTLSGEVQSYAAREAAEKIAIAADGVDGVDNKIKVNASK